MYKRSIFVVLTLVVTAGLTTSCIFDPKQKDDPGGEVKKVEYKDLTEMDHVLINLELAYNERNFQQYDKLLDDGFTFIFSDTDFNEGTVEYDQWDRNAEATSTRNILDPNLAADNRVTSIDLHLTYPEGNWSELPPDENHPDESWYTKTVNYNLVIKTADQWEHRANGLQAQFTIRWGATEDGEHWRIILWRDDVGN
jgi:hypothetical protein